MGLPLIMNKKIIISIAIVLSLIGSVSFAAVLSDYATIIGTANNVLPPEFYIGAAGSQETLLLNKKPSHCGYFGISGIYRTFKTKDFGGIDFHYLPKIKFQVRAKGVGVSTSSPILGVAFGYYDGIGTPHFLAFNFTPALSDTMRDYSLSGIPASELLPKDVHRFFYGFVKICPSGSPSSCSVSISKCADGFYTKVGLSKQNE